MDLLQELTGILGPEGILTGEAVRARGVGWADHSPCQALAVLRPSSTEQVSKALAACHAAGQPVVIMGGLTGLVRGCVAGPGEIGLSLERMRRIESVDPVNRTITLEAGVPLEVVQQEADKQGLLYPVDFGARGTAQIGATVATNAGGNSVIRYGMTRESVLGLEAVLADGTVVSSMNRMIKNNTAYDLKQLFIGSEGTLGVVTRLVLRLREAPRSVQSAMVGCEKFSDVTKLLKHMDAALGGMLSAFEVMWNEYYRQVTTPPAKGSPPIGQDHAYYVLIESSGGDSTRDQERFEEALGEAIEQGIVADAVISSSEAQRESLWALRDDIESVFRCGYPIGFDISLPVTEMESYVAEMLARLEHDWPAYRRFVFGHLGDGNLHVIAAGPFSREAKEAIERCVYEPLAARSGSVSAEHGIGLEKQPWLKLSRTDTELELMKRLKTALDPKGILNPGRVLPA